MEVPCERVFINGDIEIFNGILPRTPGYALLQAAIRGMVKLRFLAGLACHLAEAIGRSERFMCRRSSANWSPTRSWSPDWCARRRRRWRCGATRALPHRSLAATLWVLIPQAQMRAAEVIRQLSGSGLIMTPTRERFRQSRDRAHTSKNICSGKDAVAARDRVQLFKLAWDMIGEPFGSRQLQYEWFYSGDPYFTRARFYRSAGRARIQSDGRAGCLKRDPQLSAASRVDGPTGRAPGDPSEDRARHQAGAARIIEVEEAADQLARRIKSANRQPVGIDHRAVGIDAQAAEGERDSAGDRVSLERRRIDSIRPVALVDREAARRAAVLDIGVEGVPRCCTAAL